MHEKLNEIITSDPDYRAARDAVKANIITRISLMLTGRQAWAKLLKPNEDGSESAIMTSYKARLAVKEQALQPQIKLPDAPPAPRVAGQRHIRRRTHWS